MAEVIDLNADVGEGVGDDLALIPLVTSASVACGGHAGDEATMEAAVRAALAAGVAIGAHPGHEDRANFGRVERAITPSEAARLVASQVERLGALAARCGGEVGYVKLHGALYHQVNRVAALANAVVEAVGGLPLLGPPAGELRRSAAAVGVSYHGEAFVDRAYLADGSLVPRSTPGAVLGTEESVVHQALGIALRGEATSSDGRVVSVSADSLCLHGDHPGAALLAVAVRRALHEERVMVRSFAER